MRIQQPDSFFGVAMGGPRLVLSDREKATLKAAHAIFDKADNLLLDSGLVDQDDYDVRGFLLQGWESTRQLAEDGVNL